MTDTIACTLTDAQFREREVTLLAQFRSVVTAIEELPNGYAFSIPGDKEAIPMLAELIAAERHCCPFLTFELTFEANSGPIVVRVTVAGGSKNLLKTMFM